MSKLINFSCYFEEIIHFSLKFSFRTVFMIQLSESHYHSRKQDYLEDPLVHKKATPSMPVLTLLKDTHSWRGSLKPSRGCVGSSTTLPFLSARLFHTARHSVIEFVICLSE